MENRISAAFNSVYYRIMEQNFNSADIADGNFSVTSERIDQLIDETYMLSGEPKPAYHIVRSGDLLAKKGESLIELANAATVHSLRRYPRPVFVILGAEQSFIGEKINIRLTLIHELEMSLMKIILN